MSRYQRLQRTMRSPVRDHKRMKNRQTRILRRAISQAFDKVIAPQFPGGFHISQVREPTPREQFRKLLKVKRREKREWAGTR